MLYRPQIGLLPELVEDPEVELNYLMSQALITVSTLPFHLVQVCIQVQVQENNRLVQDMWRWRVFSGSVPAAQWNTEFWRLSEEVAGVAAPVPRAAADLDPVTLYHVSQDWDMMRYFTRTLLQFQFAESLCQLAGHSGPTHRCDFSGSGEAGAALQAVMQLGAREPWPRALAALTGQSKLSAQPLLRYFQPLQEWLREENSRAGNRPGWTASQTA